MNVRIQRMVHKVVCRFITINYEKASNSKVYLDMLDILAEWEGYRQQHASGYMVDPKDINKALLEIFGTDIKIDEDRNRVYGLSRKPPRPCKVRRAPTAEEGKETQWRYRMDAKWTHWTNSRAIDSKTSPFPVEQFANYVKTWPDEVVCAESSIPDTIKYLSSLECLYYDQTDGMWHFHRKV